MNAVTIEAPDGRHYARLAEGDDGVAIEFWLRLAPTQPGPAPDKRLGRLILEIPLHLARDRVHDILKGQVQ